MADICKINEWCIKYTVLTATKKIMQKLQIRPWRSTSLRQTRCVRELLPRHVPYPQVHGAICQELQHPLVRLLLFSSILRSCTFTRISFSVSLAAMEGARGRRRRRRTSREPEPSVLRISSHLFEFVAATSVRGNCRARDLTGDCARSNSVTSRS